MKDKYITEKEAIKLLRKYSNSKKDFNSVLKHCLAVKRQAVKIGKEVNADLEFLKIASILHDIGRFKCPPKTKASFKHGIEGAKILRKEKLPKQANCAERHLGCGINKKDIKDYKLPLPPKSYVPLTKEEKVLSYADSLYKNDKFAGIKYVLERAKNMPGIKKKVISVHNQLVKLGMKKKKIA